MDTVIPITRLEDAINFWRNRFPAIGEEARLCAQASALATPYALMILSGRRDVAVAELDEPAREALAEWQAAMNAGKSTGG
ncbi:DUF3717 domain-containing protein [Bordetella bronchialis]|uniref:DUF3717 domain-containing protein n=1 Tax=Bordetella bronchialis TaxID=463025 RepID=A0ABM6CMC8_9BORD|nr:DUF3717 domain-containing protein [Bordetella bronchialis]ANN65088.1 hypothetical protein BAU06_01050 [Bordetella bronchialis]